MNDEIPCLTKAETREIDRLKQRRTVLYGMILAKITLEQECEREKAEKFADLWFDCWSPVGGNTNLSHGLYILIHEHYMAGETIGDIENSAMMRGELGGTTADEVFG